MAITPLMPVYPRSPVRPVRGEGVYLYGEEGEKYLDFAAGIAVNMLGHGHPHLTKAIQEQAATLMHVSNLYGSPQGEAFAQAAVDLTASPTRCSSPIRAPRRSSARSRPRAATITPTGNSRKHDLITFSNAFHGRTMATISATDQPKLIDGFAPLLPGFKVVEFNDLDAAEAAIDENTAGFLVEPVQGEGGIRPARPRIPQGLRRRCDERDLMLVFDEVQCGVARTGSSTPTSITASSPTSSPRPRGSAAASRWARASPPRKPRRGWWSAPTARPMAATRWPWRRGRRCSTSSLEPGFLDHVRGWASGCAARSSR
jgi:acetylornithine/N-succinyldiaminopimelate aminotransferase